VVAAAVAAEVVVAAAEAAAPEAAAPEAVAREAVSFVAVAAEAAGTFGTAVGGATASARAGVWLGPSGSGSATEQKGSFPFVS